VVLKYFEPSNILSRGALNIMLHTAGWVPVYGCLFVCGFFWLFLGVVSVLACCFDLAVVGGSGDPRDSDFTVFLYEGCCYCFDIFNNSWGFADCVSFQCFHRG
jgi:hypothetical protein